MSQNRFLQRLNDRFEHEPERLFARFWQGDERHDLTYGELSRRVGAHARAWSAAGVQAGDIVFIILPHGPDQMSAFLAAMWIGAVPSFLPGPNVRQDADLYWRAHERVFARTQASALLTEPALAHEIAAKISGGSGLSVLTPVHADLWTKAAAPVEIAEDAPALLQHSSGTTGLKKGVVLTYHAIVEQLEAYGPAVGLDENSRIASWLPLYHDMGLVACFLLPLYSGAQLESLDAFAWVSRPVLLLEAIETAGATHCWLPNFAFAHLARAVSPAAKHDLSSMRCWIGCSEPNRPETFEAFIERFDVPPNTLSASYAMAETVFAVSQSGGQAAPLHLQIAVENGRALPATGVGSIRLISNGRLLPGVEIAILQNGLLHREEGVVGEICVRTPFDFHGYFAAETPVAKVDGLFRTGDSGFIQNGEVFVLGRLKDLIIVNGRNFHATDIETAMHDVSGVKPGRCVALGVDNALTGSQQIVIVAESEGAAGPDVSSINRALLAAFGVPAAAVKIVPPGWICKSTAGKIARSDNLSKYLAEFV
ncbi:fatty acyl-AMP ligase [Aureimonas fodinaquatilis]|uniref:Fatty acyl-AMP ligase n=1 Tax=Aureimonas fodinaquatilis TaxID=2565783 RepID=A0A5B0DZ29_9HYPH|nr:AMP-binding protein [Aureimonas fodinaquatilis]KAA0971638.1 fatty acyl-AMP ligase [Aureimonas fodinaquatilis]